MNIYKIALNLANIKMGGVPEPGESSGKFNDNVEGLKKSDAKLTLYQILDKYSVSYYKDVLFDLKNEDYSWSVTKKVCEYANYLLEHPQSIKNLPPIIVVGNVVEDGAHRLSALYVLDKFLDAENNFWKNSSLDVIMYS